MQTIQTHDDYIAQAPKHLQSILEECRHQLREILPDAEETVKYNMPGFSIDDEVIVGYAAFSKQCGIYLRPEAIAAFSNELVAAGFQPTKTGVKFSPENPIPTELLTKLVKSSRANIGTTK